MRSFIVAAVCFAALFQSAAAMPLADSSSPSHAEKGKIGPVSMANRENVFPRTPTIVARSPQRPAPSPRPSARVTVKRATPQPPSAPQPPSTPQAPGAPQRPSAPSPSSAPSPPGAPQAPSGPQPPSPPQPTPPSGIPASMDAETDYVSGPGLNVDVYHYVPPPGDNLETHGVTTNADEMTPVGKRDSKDYYYEGPGYSLNVYQYDAPSTDNTNSHPPTVGSGNVGA